jgi:sialate O-acetylesterase
MSQRALESMPAIRGILDDHKKRVEAYPALLKAHEEAAEKAKAEGKQPPRAPANPSTSPQRPTGLYNAMIAPLSPFAIRGAIWYQGESNANRAYQYRTLFPEMIYNWRRAMGNRDFPFLFVQLAPFMAINSEPMESAWAELREAQLYTAKDVPYAAMAVITDVGDERDIHPKQKEPVGERLALAARGLAYGESVKWSGPEFDAMKIENGKAILRFRPRNGGLETPNGEEVKGFTIAGEDRRFYNAKAKIEGNSVVVWSENVANPVAVRYGWANFPVVNLRNKEGLWASPFRTDVWPGITQPKQ